MIEISMWAYALSEYDIEDITTGFSAFIKSPERFPTPGKAEVFVKQSRQHRLGHVIR